MFRKTIPNLSTTDMNMYNKYELTVKLHYKTVLNTILPKPSQCI